MSQFVVEEQGVDFFVAGGMGEVFLHRRPAIINLKCRDEGAFGDASTVANPPVAKAGPPWPPKCTADGGKYTVAHTVGGVTSSVEIALATDNSLATLAAKLETLSTVEGPSGFTVWSSTSTVACGASSEKLQLQGTQYLCRGLLS